MICNRCGTQVGENNTYCPNCGNVIGGLNINNSFQGANDVVQSNNTFQSSNGMAQSSNVFQGTNGVAQNNNSFQNINQYEEKSKYAGFGARAGAYLLDSMIMIFLGCIIFVIFFVIRTLANNETIKSVISIFVLFVPYFVILFGILLYRGIKDPEGKTLGRKVTKTIVINENGTMLKVSTSILRQFLSGIINGTLILFVVNVILILSDSKHQTLTDKIMKTVVVYK